MADRIEYCYEHGPRMPRYQCCVCKDLRMIEEHAKIELYWRNLKVLPIDDPTPPQPYP